MKKRDPNPGFHEILKRNTRSKTKESLWLYSYSYTDIINSSPHTFY